MIILMALTTFAITAQNKDADRAEQRKEMKENFTPEQKAELRAKRMTLALDLNQSQQEKVKNVFLKMEETKPQRPENWKEMTDAQKFEVKNKMLEHQIAMKKEMKNILTEEQMAKWEKSHQSKRNHPRGKRDGDRQKKSK